MNKKARCFLIDGSDIVLIKRTVLGGAYYVLPGGRAERGESFKMLFCVSVKKSLV